MLDKFNKASPALLIMLGGFVLLLGAIIDRTNSILIGIALINLAIAIKVVLRD